MNIRLPKLLKAISTLALALVLAGCASPPGEAGEVAPESAPTSETARNGDTGTPASVPAPQDTPTSTEPEVVPVGASAEPPAGDGISRQCRVDADCAIKDVGSCCGAYPQCVNKDSPTFPEQVQAQCASEGRMGVCGFPSISGCRCVQGQCEGVNDGGSDAGAVQ